MKRRNFIVHTSALALGCCVGGQLLSSCTTVHYAAHERVSGFLLVDPAEFESGKFVVIKDDTLEGPIYLRKEDDGYTALSMTCTHRGCTVDPAGDILVCPCHGAEFSKTGKVLSPPANKDLKKYEVTFEGGKIKIKTG